MNTHENKTLIATISTAIVFIIYGLIIYYQFDQTTVTQTESIRTLGASIVLLILSNIIVLKIVLFLFKLCGFWHSNEEYRLTLDERDKQIELKGMNVSHLCFGLGFILSMIGLAAGISAFSVFLMITASVGLSELIGNCRKLYLYKYGL